MTVKEICEYCKLNNIGVIDEDIDYVRLYELDKHFKLNLDDKLLGYEIVYNL